MLGSLHPAVSIRSMYFGLGFIRLSKKPLVALWKPMVLLLWLLGGVL